MVCMDMEVESAQMVAQPMIQWMLVTGKMS
jgi:hypothetical protein